MKTLGSILLAGGMLAVVYGGAFAINNLLETYQGLRKMLKTDGHIL